MKHYDVKNTNIIINTEVVKVSQVDLKNHYIKLFLKEKTYIEENLNKLTIHQKKHITKIFHLGEEEGLNVLSKPSYDCNNWYSFFYIDENIIGGYYIDVKYLNCPFFNPIYNSLLDYNLNITNTKSFSFDILSVGDMVVLLEKLQKYEELTERRLVSSFSSRYMSY